MKNHDLITVGVILDQTRGCPGSCHSRCHFSPDPLNPARQITSLLATCVVFESCGRIHVSVHSVSIGFFRRYKQKRSDRKSESELIVMLWTDHDLRSKAKNRSVTSMWSNQHNQKIGTYNMLLFIDLFYLEISLSNTLTNPTIRCRLLKVITFKQLQPET